MKKSITGKMKNITRTLIVTALLVASAQAAFAALTVTTGSDWGTYKNTQNGGGEFTLTLTDTASKSSRTIQTFCLETHEYIRLNSTYDATINTAADHGNHTSNTILGPDTISNGTAWLYSSFVQGSLTGYDYSSTAGRQTSAADLQNAIWYLEGEITSISNNTFYNAALKEFGSYAKATANYDSTASSVRVLNLTKGEHCNTTYAQDVLVATPTPIPAAAWLFGSGLLGLVGIRRKKNS